MKQLNIKNSLDPFCSTLHFLMDIETDYDSLDRISLEFKCKNSALDEERRKLSELYLLLWDREFE